MTAREVVSQERIAEGAELVRRLRARRVAYAYLRWSARDAARRQRVEGLPTPKRRADAHEQTGGNDEND